MGDLGGLFACACWLRVGMAAEIDFNDLTWRLGTATIVIDALGINIKGLFLEAVLCNMARLGAPKVDSKFNVSTVAVDTATRVINILGIRRKNLNLEASKFKVLMTEVVTVRRGLKAPKFKVLIKVSTTVNAMAVALKGLIGVMSCFETVLFDDSTPTML